MTRSVKSWFVGEVYDVGRWLENVADDRITHSVRWRRVWRLGGRMREWAGTHAGRL